MEDQDRNAMNGTAVTHMEDDDEVILVKKEIERRKREQEEAIRAVFHFSLHSE